MKKMRIRPTSKQWGGIVVATLIISSILSVASINLVDARVKVTTEPDYSSVKKLAISLSYPIERVASPRVIPMLKS